MTVTQAQESPNSVRHQKMGNHSGRAVFDLALFPELTREQELLGKLQAQKVGLETILAEWTKVSADERHDAAAHLLETGGEFTPRAVPAISKAEAQSRIRVLDESIELQGRVIRKRLEEASKVVCAQRRDEYVEIAISMTENVRQLIEAVEKEMEFRSELITAGVTSGLVDLPTVCVPISVRNWLLGQMESIYSARRWLNEITSDYPEAL